MTTLGYLILAIAIIVALVIIFVVSFVLYMRTPAPKGCEKLKIGPKNCEDCDVEGCMIYKQPHKKEE
ncbi:MAG: hypothetical protein IKQ34_03095 [Bacilli bacterium]|nr:hypothetical protein [Bacilli bacterium]